MDQRHRLRSSADIRAVWRQGKRLRHPAGMLVFRPNNLPHSRFCYSASKRVGNAVYRNRAKRLMREAIRLHISEIRSGWDCVLVANKMTTEVKLAPVEAGFLRLFGRANMLQGNDD